MTRLLVLWLLSEHPMHGYEIKKTLTDAGQRIWFELEDASIYSVLRTLVKQGLAVEDAVEVGNTGRPRTKYAITEDGRRAYESLLMHALDAVPSFTAPIDVVMSATGDLDEDSLVAGLARRAEALRARLHLIQTGARSAPSPSVADRHRAHVKAELAWTDSLTDSYSGHPLASPPIPS